MKLPGVINLFVGLALLGVCTSSNANLATAARVFTSGNWTVLRDTDPMTDKTDCTGIYKTEYGSQLVAGSFYVKVRGGLKLITTRFDDEPATNRLPTETEKKLSFVDFSGTDFSRVYGSKRLRIQVFTVLDNVVNFDFDLTGLQEANGNIKAGCPIPVAPATPAQSLNLPTAAPISAVASQQPANQTCSPELVKSLKAAGVTTAQIIKACK